jgi:hypothetical protein
MDAWEIRATPSVNDPDRQLLLVRGSPKDVAALLKRFGGQLGRPAPTQVPGFNVCLVLHRMKPAMRAKLDAWLTSQARPREAPVAPPPTAPPRPRPVPPAPPHETAPEPPAFAPEIPVFEPALPPVEMPDLSGLTPPLDLPPLHNPDFTPEPEAPVAEIPPLAPAAQTAPEPPVTPEPEKAPVDPPFSPAVKLNPDWNFETLQVGAYNRFSHAAAMSVVTSPGSMYNPLFLYGVSGTGKSHMLHSIGTALSRGLGDSVIFLTSGSRLAHGVDEALARGDMSAINTKAAQSKALLVDDIHLLAATDQNKEALAALFKSFFARKLQVVLTSIYPPKALGAIEEALQLSFAKGWSVDLKIPNPTIQKDLIAAACDRAAAAYGNDELTLLHDRLSQWGYQDFVIWIRRLIAMKAVRDVGGQLSDLQTLLNLIYEPVVGGGGDGPKSLAAAFQAPTTTSAAESLAVIVPKGRDNLAQFAAAQFYEVGGKNGLRHVYRHALWETYDPSVPFGIPFQIGEMCYRAKVTRAFIVGPPPESPLAPRALEFTQATRRILESFGVQMALIPFAGLDVSAHYINAQLDLAPAPVRV